MTDVRRQASSESLVEKIEPTSAWTEDSSCHYLLVDVPGFKKEWLKLQLDDRGHILVKGEKQTENKTIQFRESFKLPENSDPEKIRSKFDGGTLKVTVPKLVEDEEMESLETATDDNIGGKKHDQEEHDKQHEHDQDQEEHDKQHEHDQEEEQGEKHEHEHHEEGHEGEHHINHHGPIVEEGGFLGSVKEILYKNKGIAVTTVLAIALGMLLSQKFKSNAGIERHLPPM